MLAALDGNENRLALRVVPGECLQHRAAFRRQGRQCGAHAVDPLLARVERHKVGLREVPVVIGVLLRAQRVRTALGVVPVAGLLADGATGLDDVDLTARLVVDGPAERADGVHVLDLAARAERGAGPVHRHVGVDAHRAFLHLCVGRTDGGDNGTQFRRVLLGLLAGADVGTRHDLHQRHAGTVEVDQRIVTAVDATGGAADVRALAGVLLQVGPFHADAHTARQVEMTVCVDGDVVLTDLVRLRHVRVEVVLAVEDARLDAAVQREADAHRKFDCVLVQHGQSTGECERDGVDVGVRLVTEPVRRGTEELRASGKFHVHLETNDEFPPALEQLVLRGLHRTECAVAHHLPALAVSRAPPTRNIACSPSAGASTWMPIGIPCAPFPNGTLMAGCPARFVGIV